MRQIHFHNRTCAKFWDLSPVETIHSGTRRNDWCDRSVYYLVCVAISRLGSGYMYQERLNSVKQNGLIFLSFDRSMSARGDEGVWDLYSSIRFRSYFDVALPKAHQPSSPFRASHLSDRRFLLSTY